MGKKRGKKYLEALKQYDRKKVYPIDEAIEILKKIKFERFDSSVEMAVNLGVDPRHADQIVRGVVNLPHGTGKEVKILVLTSPDKEKIAKEAGADYVGLEEYLKKIEQGWLDVDVILATQDVMPQVAKYGRILGPKGLMPSPKNGRLIPPKPDALAQAIKEFKQGKVDFRVDRYGIVHLGIGKISFPTEHLVENAKEVMQTLLALKPENVKGTYVQRIHVCTSMSPSVEVERSSLMQ